MSEGDPKKKGEYPEEGELVLGTVTKVFPYGAFVKLEEHPGKEGMIHISEISAKWVKNVGDYVKEGERVVVKVLKIDRERGHIDLSLKSVKAIQKKQKLEEYQKEKRARKLIELAAEKLNDRDSLEVVIKKLEESFGALYPGLESAVVEGGKALERVEIPDKWKAELAKIAEEHIQKPRVSIKARLELSSKAPNGIRIIKGALIDAQKSCKAEDVEMSLRYQGAPNYRVVLTAPDYKKAEKCLEKFSSEVLSKVSAQGEGKLIRD